MARVGLTLLLLLAACDDPTGTGGGTDAGVDVGTDSRALDGYEGDLPVGELVELELGTGTLTTTGDGVDAMFAPLEAGRKVFASCRPDGCTLDLLARVPRGVADGSRWEMSLRDGSGDVGAFQGGDTVWQAGADGKDYQVASFYFATQEEYESSLSGAGSVELGLAREDAFEDEELIGFVSVQVAFEATNSQ